MERYEKIREYLSGLSTSELVAIHNEYCDRAKYPDDTVYSMNDFDEIMEGFKPWEVARAAFYGDFRPCDDYFRFNGYGNLVSFDWWEDENSGIDLDAIAAHIDETENDFGNDEICEILTDDETEDDDNNETTTA